MWERRRKTGEIMKDHESVTLSALTTDAKRMLRLMSSYMCTCASYTRERNRKKKDNDVRSLQLHRATCTQGETSMQSRTRGGKGGKVPKVLYHGRFFFPRASQNFLPPPRASTLVRAQRVQLSVNHGTFGMWPAFRISEHGRVQAGPLSS